jgi:hypothetical protein
MEPHWFMHRVICREQEMTRYRSFRAALVVRPCAGVLCERHERCARYELVDGTDIPSDHWLAQCRAPDVEGYSAFIDVEFVGPPAPVQFAMTRTTLRALRREALQQQAGEPRVMAFRVAA